MASISERREPAFRRLFVPIQSRSHYLGIPLPRVQAKYPMHVRNRGRKPGSRLLPPSTYARWVLSWAAPVTARCNQPLSLQPAAGLAPLMEIDVVSYLLQCHVALAGLGISAIPARPGADDVSWASLSSRRTLQVIESISNR